MSARILWACAWKEALLLWRDRQTLVLLFAMPTVFILIMSLALQERLGGSSPSVGRVAIIDRDGTEAAARLVDGLVSASDVRVHRTPGDAGVESRVRRGGADFALEIRAGFGRAIADRAGAPAQHLRLLAAPDVGQQRTALIQGRIRTQLGRMQLEQLAQRLRPMVSLDPQRLQAEVPVEYVYGPEGERRRPSSVQQNVPAWLIFGIFFVVIPLSNTMIRERQSGMEQRLRTMPVGQGTVIAGKLAPYFVVNQLQTAAMLAIGAYLVPALGGEALSLAGVAVAPLITMAVAVSVAALGYALVVAAASQTPEQAGMLGGGGNIILAAIGGIMVPEFVMPPSLQAFTDVSPMAWGLDGFLAAFLAQGGWDVVGPRASALVGFGATGMVLAVWLQSRRTA